MRLLLAILLCCSLIPSLVQAQAAADVAVGNQPESQAETQTGPIESPVTKATDAVAAVAVPQAPAPVKADTAAERPSAGLGLGKMALSLAIVVAIVIALGWAFKKLTLRLPGSRHIKIISTMPLGPKERLLVIEMQGKQRVLGVTANSINLLFELENSLPEEKLASDFHTQLQSFLKK